MTIGATRGIEREGDGRGRDVLLDPCFLFVFVLLSLRKFNLDWLFFPFWF
jgi:hypothetical protein